MEHKVYGEDDMTDGWKRYSLSANEIVDAFLNGEHVFYVDDSVKCDEAGLSVSKAKIDEIVPDEDHFGEIAELRASFQGVRYWLIPRRERYRLVSKHGARVFLSEYGLRESRQ